MRSFVVGLVALPAALGLAVPPFPVPNGNSPLPPGPTGTGSPYSIPNGTHPFPPGPTGTGAPWVQTPPTEGGDLAPPVKRDTPRLNEKRFFPMPNGTVPHPPSPSGTGVPCGTGAPWVQFPPAEEQGQQDLAPPVKRQLNGLNDILKAPSDSLPVKTDDLKDLPKIPKEFIPSMPIPVPFNGTWPIINGTIPGTNGTIPPCNNTGTK